MKRILWKLFEWSLVCVIVFALGYGGRMFHEAYNAKFFESQAEQQLREMDAEFAKAWEKGYEFYIFNGKYKVYPVRWHVKRFAFIKKRRG